MTLRLMGHISRLMREVSAKLLSGLMRLSESSILRADKDILTLLDKARPTCMDGRRALIIDEKYLGKVMKYVTCVIDGYTGEIYGQTGYIRTLYTYTPYGSVTEEGDISQPIQWSSEFYDTEMGLVYYNYRHYNPRNGRWLTRDILDGVVQLYCYLK